MSELPWRFSDGGPTRAGRLPILQKGPSGPRWALLHYAAVPAVPDLPATMVKRLQNEVSVPSTIFFFDPTTGRPSQPQEYFDEQRRARLGLAEPSNPVIGRLDDPTWLPKDRVEALRQRIYAALDILLPFFLDEGRAWTQEANKAAQEVRDFCPLAAEPGLWPYYKAEGKEFFSWVEKNAPPAKAPLPWEAPAR